MSIWYVLLCIVGAVSWAVLALFCYCLFRSRWWLYFDSGDSS